MNSSEILIPITMFLSTFGVLYIFFMTRHKERMSMIDKGVDPKLFQSKQDGRFTSMRFGMLLVGMAIGILTGNILTVTTNLIEPVAYFSMIFLFGGLSLITYYMFVNKNSGNGQ